MDNKIIKESNNINLFIKIKTVYSKNLVLDYFNSNKDNIKEDVGQGIPIIISDINVSETSSEKNIKEAIDISYSNLDIHKYIYIKISYNFKYDIIKECHNIFIKYLREIFDKYTLSFIQNEKDKLNRQKYEILESQNKHIKTINSNLKNKKKKK
jgi:hypothetical protein